MKLNLRRGMNLPGMNLSGPGAPGNKLSKSEMMRIVKEAGFDHVRFPFPFNGKTPESTEGPEYYALIRQICELALSHDLIAFVDIHPFYLLNTEPEKYRDAFLTMWEELAEHLKDLDERIIFEIYNEPSCELDLVLNEIQNEAIRRIRKSNPARLIAAGSANCNTIENLPKLELPPDENIFVTVHDYTPMPFTHQECHWMKDPFPPNCGWGTPEEYELLEQRMDMARQWGLENNRFIHMGEFGVYSAADMKDRAAWTAHMARLCEERGIAWCYWEFNYGFGAYDPVADAWREPLLNALIPR